MGLALPSERAGLAFKASVTAAPRRGFIVGNQSDQERQASDYLRSR
jgi:hypothetical protein